MRGKKTFLILAAVVAILLLALKFGGLEGFQSGSASGVDTFTLFYADWCPHCKDVKPIFKSWGADKGSVQVNGKTVFVKMVESSEPNAKEQMEAAGVKGFPSIMFFKADGKKMEYQGDRSPSGWESFLKENV